MRERTSLSRAEAMLFVHNDVRKMLELNRLLYQRMRTDEHRDLPLRDPFQKLRARNISGSAALYFGGEFLATTSRNECDIDRQVGKIFDERLEMLAGENFRRCHIGNLKSPRSASGWPRMYDRIGCRRRDKSLPASDGR